MNKKMLQFVSLNKETPPKRDVKNRSEDFNEIYNEFISGKLKNNLADVLNVGCLFAKYIAH